MTPVKRILVLLLPLLGACAELAGPDVPVDVQLTASRTEIAPGDTVRLVATLTNRTDEPLVLTFGGCQVLPYVHSAAGEMVVPGGGWMCLAVMSSLEIAPRGTHTATFVWTGQRSLYQSGTVEPYSEPLPAGEYRAHAVLVKNSHTGEIRSNEVVLRIR